MIRQTQSRHFYLVFFYKQTTAGQCVAMAKAQKSGSRGRPCYPVLFIRCRGIQDQVKHYFVFERQEGPETHLLYRLQVNENTQEARALKLNIEEVVIESRGGLHAYNQQMTVIDYAGGIVGTMDNRVLITNPSAQDPKLGYTWQVATVTSEDRNPDSSHISMMDSAGRENAKITGFKASASVAIKLVSLNLMRQSPTTKLMLMMAGLKIYYGVHRFHQLPVPVGIPCMMSSGTPLPPDLSILANMSHVRIRMAERTRHIETFLEVLDAQSNKIILVITETGTHTVYLTCKDRFGIVQFMTVNTGHAKGNLVSTRVRDHFLNHFGTIFTASKELSDHHDSATVLKERSINPRPSQRSDYQVKQIMINRPPTSTQVCAAEYYLDADSNDLIVTMLLTLDVRKKALVLTQAIITAVTEFGIKNLAPLPTVNDYSYQ